MKQLTHYKTMNRMTFKTTEMVLFICGITAENLGLILRTADIFSVKKIYYYGDITSNENKIKKISRNANIPIEFKNDFNILNELEKQGYEIVSLEITDNSKPLRTAILKSKLCLIIGNEKNGIPQPILDKSKCSYHIEMIGENISSLNVAIATSIFLNKYVEQKNDDVLEK